jgi:hypothetical protein
MKDAAHSKRIMTALYWCANRTTAPKLRETTIGHVRVLQLALGYTQLDIDVGT